MLQCKCEEILIESSERLQFLDITEKVRGIIKKHTFFQGIIDLYNMHTTSGIWVNEHEKGLLEDVKKRLQLLAKDDEYYRHDDFAVRTENIDPNGAERKNAPAHLRSTLFRTNVCFHVRDGQLVLGRWQSVLYAELDGPQQRRLQCMMVGEFTH